MKIKRILKTTSHRPWDLPTQGWSYYQEWNNTIFLHWEVNLQELKKFVPKDLEIDLFNGKAYVSLVAFTMEKIRPKHLPHFPPISNFHEINIRTYVKHNDKTGVYFLSIEGGTYLSCKISRAISELPYCYSKMIRSEGVYSSINKEFNDSLNLQFQIGKPITTKTELELWLTERYALFQDYNDQINSFEIHHLEWPTKEICLTNLKVNYPRFKNLLKNHPSIMNYSQGVQVLAWKKS